MKSKIKVSNLAFGFLQKIGKALMLPVSVLPVAGILLGVGAAKLGFIPADVSTIMAAAGDAIFSCLPLLFAIGVAIGFTKDEGAAALSAVIGYLVMLATMGGFAKIFSVSTVNMLGIATINTGVLGGIIIGALAALIFNRFHEFQLPSYLGFFSGKRLVPILSAVAAIGVGFLMSLAWPPVGNLIAQFSNWSAHESPKLAFFIYGVVERALIPFGLHHIWNVPFFFEAGTFTDPATGKIVSGEIARYLAGDPIAGNLAGGYLFKMWGLPAAAIAIWHKARPENRKRVAGIMISAALTSFMTGITEPIEFSFLFIAPLLYGFHALLAGFAFVVCISLGIKHGTTFSHGLIDYILLYSKSTHGAWFWVIGPIWACAYYFGFRYIIERYSLATPGREILASEINGTTTDENFTNGSISPAASDLAQQVIVALGGADNIQNIDACITRLRTSLKDAQMVNESALKALGATGTVKIGNGVQVIFGTRSEHIKNQIRQIMLESQGSKSLTTKVSRAASTTQDSTVTASHLNESTASKLSGYSFVETKNIDEERLADGLGGRNNIEKLERIAGTRICISLKDPNLTSASILNELLPKRWVQFGNSVHILAGNQCAELETKLG